MCDAVFLSFISRLRRELMTPSAWRTLDLLLIGERKCTKPPDAYRRPEYLGSVELKRPAGVFSELDNIDCLFVGAGLRTRNVLDADGVYPA